MTTTPKTEATRLAEFKDLEYWPAGVGLTDWVESACAEMLRLDAALADELNNRDVLDKMLTQCITERDQLRAQVEQMQGGETAVRFCPGCGSVGAVPDTYKDCCPDGNHARMIPESLARRCNDLFYLALNAAQSASQKPVTLTEREIGDCIDKTNRESQYGHHHFGWSKDLAANIIAALRWKEAQP